MQMNDNIFAGLKAMIFDLDGTLVDSNELHVEAWERAFRHFGKAFTVEELRKQIGKGSDQYLPEFLTAEEIERFGKELDIYRSDLFKNEYLRRVKPFPQVRELFECLQRDGKRIVLASSGKKPEVMHYIKLLRIKNLIESETTAEDAESSKPAPDIFVAAVRKLGVLPKEAIVAGDTPFDMEAARKAHLKSIAFLCGGPDKETLKNSGPLAIYRDPADLLSAIED